MNSFTAHSALSLNFARENTANPDIATVKAVLIACKRFLSRATVF
jgi:hypothetical protein